jgi:hypothetical protein
MSPWVGSHIIMNGIVKRKFLERTPSHTLASLRFLEESPKKDNRLGARENRPSIEMLTRLGSYIYVYTTND